MSIRKVRVYLAAPYYRKAEIQEYKNFLQTLGIEVTSRWMEEAHAPKTQMGEVAEDLHVTYALNDLEDVLNADMIVSFTEPMAEQPVQAEEFNRAKRGGRHVEFGFGMALGKELILVGPRENIFHYLPQVEQYDTFALFLAKHKNRGGSK